MEEEPIMDTTLKRIRTQNDQRVVEEANYKGYHVKVACSYSGTHDEYFVHLYLVPPDGLEEPMFDPARTANTLNEGLDRAFAVAISEIDHRIP